MGIWRTRNKRAWWVSVGILTVSMLLAAGLGYALWNASGSGPGTASSISAGTITVAASTGAADLYPGFADGDLYFTLDNPNPYPVTFTTATPGSLSTTSPAGCAAATYLALDPGPWTVSITVAANAVAQPASIADVVQMSAGAPDGCQSKSFSVSLTLAGTQS